MTDKNRKLEFAEDARTFHRLSNKPPLLDDDNNLLPSVTTPRRPKPSGEIPGGEWNDGSDLQYLGHLQAFPERHSPAGDGVQLQQAQGRADCRGAGSTATEPDGHRQRTRRFP